MRFKLLKKVRRLRPFNQWDQSVSFRDTQQEGGIFKNIKRNEKQRFKKIKKKKKN